MENSHNTDGNIYCKIGYMKVDAFEKKNFLLNALWPITCIPKRTMRSKPYKKLLLNPNVVGTA